MDGDFCSSDGENWELSSGVDMHGGGSCPFKQKRHFWILSLLAQGNNQLM